MKVVFRGEILLYQIVFSLSRQAGMKHTRKETCKNTKNTVIYSRRGHGLRLQDLTSVGLPSDAQSFPPCNGIGLSQFLFLEWASVPQVFEQVP